MSTETALVLALKQALETVEQQHNAKLQSTIAELALVNSKYRSLIDNLNEREDTPMQCGACEHWFAPDSLLYDTPLVNSYLICEACYLKLPVSCDHCHEERPIGRMRRPPDNRYYEMQPPFFCKTCN